MARRSGQKQASCTAELIRSEMTVPYLSIPTVSSLLLPLRGPAPCGGRL